MECGSEDALAATQELEIGLYRLTLKTPLACTEAALREAEGRLEAFGGWEGLGSEEAGVLRAASGGGGAEGAAVRDQREEL